MKEYKVPVQSLIDHIKTAIDVDPWAKEMAEELLKEHEHEVCENCPYKLEDIGDFSDGYHTFNDLYNAAEMDYKPTIGAWIRHGEPPQYVVECSRCGTKYFNHALQPFARYCSGCGAKMESWIVDDQTEAT